MILKSLMKNVMFAGILGAGLLLAGCSSVPTEVDKGPIKASTFSFMNVNARQAEFAETDKAVHGAIQQAIASNLAAKGVRQVQSDGDVTVSYLLIIGNNVSTTSINDYFGYGPDAEALHEKAQNAYSGVKDRNYLEAGTLLIDIIDAKTQKLLRRSHVTKPLLKNPTAEARAARIQEAVNETLNGLQIVH
jgi:hypothetical protein